MHSYALQSITDKCMPHVTFSALILPSLQGNEHP